jgi:putative nucleotidyltransferase with HDIG domain
VVSEGTSQRPILTLDDLALPLSRRPERLWSLGVSDLSVAFSQALDLAEGKQVGHAQRVAYIAIALADALEVEPAQRTGAFLGGLLHDVGVTSASAEICRIAGVDEETIFGPSPLRGPREIRGALPFADIETIVDAVHQHTTIGAELVRKLELPEEAAAAVAGHHERWDGRGFPEGLAGEAIGLEARIVAAADVAEVTIAAEHSSLIARRRFAAAIAPHSGSTIEPHIASALLEVAKADEFWLGLYSHELAESLSAVKVTSDGRKSRRRVMRFAEVFADLADAKGGHTREHSSKTAQGAEDLARAVGLDEGHVEMVRIAALLHDVGLLGVPARVMAKPDILSVTEMQLMRQHPQHSQMILSALPGFEEVAFWISRHHERPDGKGYPEMLTGDEIPLESRILAVADVYAALTAERPHRGALSDEEAKKILLNAAGTQLDPELTQTFCAVA